MLIHITPTLFLAFHNYSCELVDLSVKEFGLVLKNERDIVARKPFPNKHYLVACRKTGRKAVGGILIESPLQTDSFTVITRWAVSASLVVTHKVNYVVMDRDFDAVSDNMMLWGEISQYVKKWRCPNFVNGTTPSRAQPRMDIYPASLSGAERDGDVKDIIKNGLIIERNEVFSLPTIEKVYLLNSTINERLPLIETAFEASPVFSREKRSM